MGVTSLIYQLESGKLTTNIYSISLYRSALKGSEGNMHSPIKVNILFIFNRNTSNLTKVL